MEILQSAKDIYKHTCNYCGCVFAYGKLDVKQEMSRYNEYVNTIRCPECDVKQIVNLVKRYKED